ncbi:MAG: DUF4253 domain-containing protein [Oscillospiraceae bacterium]|jgi:hypothetical protein|nr:DUF4253 domain-containing protein [Oscillospiraceae bacterium]
MTDEEKKITEELIAFMDCPCRVFEPMEDDDPILEAYAEAKERGKAQGFTPLLLGVEDLLLEDLLMNCGAESASDLKTIRKYRENLLAQAEKKGFEKENTQWLDEESQKLLTEERARQELGDASASGELVEGFAAYWDFLSQCTRPVVLAEIPVKEPWKVFAWLCIGGWNECPSPETFMAVSKRWYEQYGAVPASACHDILEYALNCPVPSREMANQLALEQYVFCVDRVEQSAPGETLGTLADTLTKSKVWYFWWD